MPIGTDGLAPIAVVTGGSRGLGRGIAIGLGEAGVNVIITGRDTGALAHTAERVHHVGGRAVPITCDHRDDDQVAAVFGRVAEEYGRLDLLVNNATSFPSVRTLFTPTPFWKTPLSLWDELMTVGLRSHLVAASHAVPVMLGRHGLIVNVSSAAAAVQVPAVIGYGVGKAALDRLTADMARDLADRGITVMSLWPPPTSTEGMLADADEGDDPTTWSTPVFTGRVIASLLQDPKLDSRTGTAARVRDLARELGVEDDLYRTP